jgi:cytochrome bd-type quinol oxidase subunit 2
MLKSILAIIASYAVMFVVLFLAFTGCYLALGPEGAFQTDSYEVSTVWIALTVVVCLAAGVIGGFLCAAISKSKRTCQVFAFIVFFLGLVACIPAMKRNPDAPNVRAGEVSSLDAMGLAVSPMWLHLLTPVVSAAGVLLGARMKGRGQVA